MTGFVLIVVLLSAVFGSVFCSRAEWLANRTLCADTHKVKLEDVKDAIHGRTPEASVTQDMKCYFLCMGKKQNFIKDGAFQPQAFTAAMSTRDKDLVAKAATECNVKGKDDCDTGYKVATCLAKHQLRKRM